MRCVLYVILHNQSMQIGTRDLESASCTVARRDHPGKDGKLAGVPLLADQLVPQVQDLLDQVQSSLLEDARQFRDSNIVDVQSYSELQEAVAQGTCCAQ